MTLVNISATDDLMPFTNAKIGNAALDFSDDVNASTVYNNYNWNRARGVVTDQPNSNDSSVSMLWESGNALISPGAKTCSFDNTTCYKVKTVPVIKSVSQTQGYTTGG